MASFYNPVKILWGINKIDELSHIVENLYTNINRILILTGSKSLKQSGYLDKILSHFGDKEVLTYSNIPSNPEISDIYDIKTKTDSFNYDMIISIGGGSVLDVGKCLVAFKNMNIESIEILETNIISKNYQKYNIDTPIMAIPTTSGTGSEVTCWATVWDKVNNKKYSVEDKRIYPKIAVIDPILTMNLPLNLTASTALDALSHALEAYWSKKSNEIVRLYASKSIELIVNNMNDLLDDLSNLELREKIAQGSLYAGLAFSNTKTTACHSISYPLTAKYNIPHGIATSMTLNKFLNINNESIIDKSELLKSFNVERISEVEEVINNIYNKAGISYKLRDYGVEERDINFIVKHSFTPDRMNNNPVKITEEILTRVLKDIY